MNQRASSHLPSSASGHRLSAPPYRDDLEFNPYGDYNAVPHAGAAAVAMGGAGAHEIAGAHPHSGNGQAAPYGNSGYVAEPPAVAGVRDREGRGHVLSGSSEPLLASFNNGNGHQGQEFNPYTAAPLPPPPPPRNPLRKSQESQSTSESDGASPPPAVTSNGDDRLDPTLRTRRRASQRSNATDLRDEEDYTRPILGVRVVFPLVVTAYLILCLARFATRRTHPPSQKSRNDNPAVATKIQTLPPGNVTFLLLTIFLLAFFQSFIYYLSIRMDTHSTLLAVSPTALAITISRTYIISRLSCLFPPMFIPFIPTMFIPFPVFIFFVMNFIRYPMFISPLPPPSTLATCAI